jgi:hypothetical protein
MLSPAFNPGNPVDIGYLDRRSFGGSQCTVHIEPCRWLQLDVYLIGIAQYQIGTT